MAAPASAGRSPALSFRRPAPVDLSNASLRELFTAPVPPALQSHIDKHPRSLQANFYAFAIYRVHAYLLHTREPDTYAHIFACLLYILESHDDSTEIKALKGAFWALQGELTHPEHAILTEMTQHWSTFREAATAFARSKRCCDWPSVERHVLQNVKPFATNQLLIAAGHTLMDRVPELQQRWKKQVKGANNLNDREANIRALWRVADKQHTIILASSQVGPLMHEALRNYLSIFEVTDRR